MIGSIAPIIADVVVAWAVHGKPDIALQILLIDLQSAALAGLVSLTSEHAVGRGRPFSADCNADGDVLDANGRPTEVDPIVPETPDEKRRYDRAAKRRANRVMERRYDQGRGE